MQALILVVALLEPKPLIQEQIAKVVAAFNQSGDPVPLNAPAAEALKALNALADKAEIVNQVAVYAAGPGKEPPLMALAIVHWLDVPPSVVIRTLAPHLDAANPNLRSFVRDWFQGHDNGGPDDPLKPVNFRDYVSYARNNPPAAFVDYLFERSPDRALIVFYRATRADDRNILLAAHTIENAIWLKKNRFDDEFRVAVPAAKEQLAKLTGHDQLWVRRYVAEITRRHPELRVAEIVEKLSNDGNASVSTAAKATKE